MVPANQRLGLAGQPLAARAALDLGLVAQNELAVIDRALDFLPGKAEHAAPAAPGRPGQLVEVELLADPFDIVEIGELVRELGAIAAAQRLAVRRDDDPERGAVESIPQGAENLRCHVALGQDDNTAGLAGHEFGKRRRAGEVAGREAHLANDVVERAMGLDGFIRN